MCSRFIILFLSAVIALHRALFFFFFLYSLDVFKQKNERKRNRKRISERVKRQHLGKDNRGNNIPFVRKQRNMNIETKNPPPSVVSADEVISLIDENTQVPISSSILKSNEKNKSTMLLTRKSLTQHRLMRWFAFILSLGTLIVIWRYISILILAVWLSSICRPLLEWLVNHL
jgi:ABC-type glutathione transport system ATPase component